MNSNTSQSKIKIGICAMAILMMGVVGVSSSLSVIGAHFADASQNTIQSLISIPCLVILPATLISGKLMDFMPKKILGMIGIIFFLRWILKTPSTADASQKETQTPETE